MPVEIKVPSVGESISEGTIARWLKAEGAHVKADEPVFELETEKATTQVAAPAEGMLHIDVAEGETVPVGSVVGHLQEGAAPAGKEKIRETSPPAGKEKTRETSPPAKQEPAKQAPAPAPSPAREANVAPAARQLAHDKQVEVGQVTGTGRGG